MAEKCATHKRQHRTVNLTLLSLILMGLVLMTWHVWTYGTHEGGLTALEGRFFPLVLLEEVWHLIIGGHGILGEIGDIWIYFLIGILLAAWIRTYKFHIRLRKTLIKYGFGGIFLAALIGVFSPLCACGILTTAVTLVAVGLPLAPVMALLIASPLMSPTAYLLTINDLGAEWAFIRTLAAFLMGVLGGVVTHLLRKKYFSENLFTDGTMVDGELDVHDPDYPDERLRCTCREKFSNRIAAKHPNKFIIYWAKALEMTWSIGKYVLVGIAVGTIIQEYMPQQWLIGLFGHQSAFSPIWVTIGSIPIFLHQISASSILYHIKETLPGTLNKGAALAFLIGGPVTAIPAMLVLWSMFKKRVFVLYMVISICGTIFFAYTFNWFIFPNYTDSGSPVFHGVAAISGGEASIIQKSHEYVHIAADPGDKPLIAVYKDVEGGSGLVFDADLSRFTNAGLDLQDNKLYIRNIARWLEEASFSGTNRKILLYNTYSGSGSGYNSDQLSALPGLLKEYGFEATLTDRRADPEITPELLGGYKQLWIISGECQSATFRPEEVETMLDFREDGSALLLVAGPQNGPQQDFTRDANQIAKNFGVTFAGVTKTPAVIPISVVGRFAKPVADKLAGWFKTMRQLEAKDEAT